MLPYAANYSLARLTMPAKTKPDFIARLREVPHQPGVYIMRDRLDRVVYVGKARDLRRRLSNYFAPSRSRVADIKTRALIASIWNFEWHTVHSDPEAILLEGRLIKQFRPKYNISFRDDKRFLLVKINESDPWPRFQLTRLRKEDGSRYFGPFPHAGALRSALAWLQKEYGIRSCRPSTPGENDYRHCLDHVIRRCSAPCIGRISRDEYMQRVRKACDFLEGKSREAIDAVAEEMRQAAERLDFERAATLRDLHDALKRTSKPIRRFTRHDLPRVLDPAADLRALRDALRLSAPPTLMECFDISNISNTHIVASMVCFRDGVPDRSAYRRYRITGSHGQNDFASMAEVVRRRYSRVLSDIRKAAGSALDDTQLGSAEATQWISRNRPHSPRLPDLVIVDGGRGQLSKACSELQRLGLHDIPIIGLAKEFEEIYRPGKPVPLRLPADSGALKMLQRIRDEAHRFANGYHQLLMKRRISESILDDCPGISQSRKKDLLRHFGTIQRLKKATIEEIQAIDGIGPKLAANLVEFLNKSQSSPPSLTI